METAKREQEKQETMFYKLLEECQLMTRYALGNGLVVPPAVIHIVTQLSENQARRSANSDLPPEEKPVSGVTSAAIRRLGIVHQRLSRIVTPATPWTISFYRREASRGGFWGFLGPVPLVRQMMLVAIFSIAAFIIVSLSPLVDAGDDAGDFLKTSGIALLVNELFYLSAAGLGASFAALFVANKHVASASFDPKYNSSYWIRFVLGLMAGLMLATTLSASFPKALRTLAKPSLAMLGGFSAATVYRIMARLIDTMESLIRGDLKELRRLDARTLENRLSEEVAHERIKVVNAVISVKQQLSAGASPEELHSRLDQVLQNLLPPDLDSVADNVEAFQADPGN